MTAAIFGLLGVAVGGVLQIVAQQWSARRQRQLDKDRKRLLIKLLSDSRWKWRKLTICQQVIGADADTTTRLLIEIGARGSQSDPHLWGLVTRNPFGDDVASEIGGTSS